MSATTTRHATIRQAMTPHPTTPHPAGLPDAAALDAATPPTRDRYVDLLRVVSLGTVILGHWLMITPVIGTDGSVRVTNLLALAPGLQPLTWVLQVMPVFFLVGGFSQATGLASVQRRGGSYADFLRSRATRLLRPTGVFVGVWLLLALAAGLSGTDGGLVRIALRTVAQPLWFLGVYLGVVALAPLTWRLHRRAGRWAPLIPAGLLGTAGAVDVLRFAGVPHVAYLNVALVWIGVHQLGYLYADGTLRRGGRRLGWALTSAGLGAVVLLTTAGPYPVSMVGIPGEHMSNMSPPSLALAAQAVFLTGLVLVLRGPALRRLARARVWRAVVAANLLAMTAFLWHLSAAFVALAGTLALGLTGPPAGTAAWWWLRPLWLVALVVLTGALVAVFRRFDTPRPTGPVTGGGRRDAVAAVGAVLATIGVLGISAVGFGGLLEGRTALLIVLPVNAPAAVAAIAVGATMIAAAGGRRR